MESPTPDVIKHFRKEAGLSQREAGELIHTKPRQFEPWEQGINKMPPGLWELFLLKIGQHQLYELKKK